MPYIVTTKRPESIYGERETEYVKWIESRRAVATLEEARRHVATWATMEDAISVPESGGTVGPLPDKTEIEVRIASDGELLMGVAPGYHLRWAYMTTEEKCAAYNAAQQVRA